MLRWVYLFAVAIVLSSCGDDDTGTPKNETKIKIVNPSNGQAVYTNRLLSITVQLPSIEAFSTVDLVIRLKKGGDNALVLKGRLQRQGAIAEIDWQPKGVKSGTYQLTVVATSPKKTIFEQVEFKILQPPQVDVKIKELRRIDQNLEATLIASASSPDGIQIDSFVWTLGRGIKPIATKQPTLKHTFKLSSKSDYLYLKVFDVLGGVSSTIRRLNFPGLIALTTPDPNIFLGMVPPPQPCGCASMTIRRTANQNSDVYCMTPAKLRTLPGCQAVPAAQIPAGEGCPAGKTAANCRLNVHQALGANRPRQNLTRFLGFGFEVVSTLNQGSAADECEEGQFTQADIELTQLAIRNGPIGAQPAPNTRHTFTKPNPPGGNEVVETVRAGLPVPPYQSNFWGSDDYDDESDFKRHLGLTVRWFDAPGNNHAGPLLHPSVHKFRFFTFVKGSTGECWCKFRFEHGWIAGRGYMTLPPGVVLEDGLNCTLG